MVRSAEDARDDKGNMSDQESKLASKPRIQPTNDSNSPGTKPATTPEPEMPQGVTEVHTPGARPPLHPALIERMLSDAREAQAELDAAAQSGAGELTTPTVRPQDPEKPLTRSDLLEFEIKGLREQLKQTEQRAEKWHALFWLLMVVAITLVLTVAELKGCVSHDQGNEMELPY